MTDPQNPDKKGTEDEWAEAMAQQQAEEGNDETSDDAEEDLWAAAMAEQQATEDEANAEASDPAPDKSQAQNADHEVFKPLDEGASSTTPRDLDLIMDIPVKLSVELGRTKITIKQLLELAQGSVIELDGLAGEPMDILINGYLIAQGEVVVVDDKYGIRITEIITPSERVKKLNK
ncbi:MULTISPECIES: flagellar motor switch protein FliN [Chromohalobacter]|uniref:Flagellar motor switch protein FliN n=1 Tax=Chromohalobacter israelensis (strain ATCC BAA-138 / DSM 3043 / CIP 106854 / NCIMB 13768 / 1H11) TaxID=290398 RepID=Q1QW43_CHRI1|nr:MULTISPECIES: flagellar motor switch protein FliN [Chromohalobacter]ABE59315.1 Flagellar motor switch FliN [Chromohalobacter salexigens DSM 3043]MBZ5876984.1 flagellar motor switch protein FliN [Chromohalobacter salexigens]MDF9434338.1 flagellar motor switch protein FliN [Chromohalobacter israelensis]NWO56717.1 flagellar motor switch protein FliN [Chromohalobacter salexigens]PWW40591.1 flagellar motor switch protein FliN/FliY [Chromohalobacter salexigens]